MQTIYKYEVPIEDEFVVELPESAKILCVQVQHGEPFFWALVDTANQPERRRFSLRGTGHVLDEYLVESANYVGSFQLRGGALVFHLFDRLEWEDE